MVKSKATAYLLIACVFLLGVVAGGGAMMAWTSSERAAITREGPAGRHKLHALSRKLDLDGDQESRIASILASDADESRELLRDHRAHVDDEIRTVLRPDQRRRFEHMIEQRKHTRYR